MGNGKKGKISLDDILKKLSGKKKARVKPRAGRAPKAGARKALPKPAKKEKLKPSVLQQAFVVLPAKPADPKESSENPTRSQLRKYQMDMRKFQAKARKLERQSSKAVESIARKRTQLYEYMNPGSAADAKKNSESLMNLIFASYERIEKFADPSWGWFSNNIQPSYDVKMGKTMKVFPEKAFGEQSVQNKLSAIRIYLFDTVAKGNEGFKKELEGIYGKGKIPLIDEALLAKKLDHQTVLAAAAYLRRYAGELRKEGLGTKLTPLSIEPLKPEKFVVVRTPIVAAIGASTTGENIGQKSGYVLALEKKLKALSKGSVVDAYGIKGQNTTQILSRSVEKKKGIYNLLETFNKYNTIIILGGINDAYQGVPVQTTTRNLEIMVECARKKGKHVILLTIFPHKFHGDPPKPVPKDVLARFREINKWIKKQKTEGVDVVETPPFTHLHPGAEVTAKIGELVYEQVLRKRMIKALKDEVKPTKVPRAEPGLSEEDRKIYEQAMKLVELAKTKNPYELMQSLKKIEASKYSKVMKITLQNLFNYAKGSPSTGLLSFLAIYDNKEKPYSSKLGSIELNNTDLDPLVGLATQSILDFLNYRSKLKGAKFDNFKWAVSTLNQELGRGNGTNFKVNRNDYRSAILGLSVYFWSIDNSDKKPNAWIPGRSEAKKLEAAGVRRIK